MVQCTVPSRKQERDDGNEDDDVYWRGEKFWLGKVLEYPEIMTQGETLEELEENIRDAYRLMVLEDVPEEHQVKQIAV